jgi:hypothetical protein
MEQRQPLTESKENREKSDFDVLAENLKIPTKPVEKSYEKFFRNQIKAH